MASGSSPLLPDIAARGLTSCGPRPASKNNIWGKTNETRQGGAEWERTQLMATTTEVNPHPCTTLNEGRGNHRPRVGAPARLPCQQGMDQPLQPSPTRCWRPNINMHDPGGGEIKGRRVR